MCCLESRTGILRSRFPPLRLLLFAVGRMNTSSVTRQLWSIWEVLITMQHKKPSLCRLYQPLQSWKASSDPGGALELNKTDSEEEPFHLDSASGAGGRIGRNTPSGTPCCNLALAGAARQGCSELLWNLRVFAGEEMDTGTLIQKLPHTLGTVPAGEGKEKPTLVTSLEFSLFTNLVGSL